MKFRRNASRGAMIVAGAWATGGYAASCLVSAGAIGFGTYDPLLPAHDDSSTTIVVTCSYTGPAASEVVGYTLSLSAGTGSYAARTLLRGTSVMTYNLHASPSRDASSIWGDGTGGSVTVSASLPVLTSSNPVRLVNHTVYGRIPARQDLPVGTYVASVLLTMTY